MLSKRCLLIGLSLVILGAVIYYLEPLSIISVLSKANPFYIITAFFISCIAIIIRIFKWKIMIKNVKFSEIAPIQLFSITAGNFTPGKAAEPIKTVLLKSRTGKNVSETLPSVIWERVFDIVVLVLFSFLIISSLDQNLIYIYGVGLAIFLTLIILLFLLLFNERTGSLLFNLIKKISAFKNIPDEFIKNFYTIKIEKKRLLISFLLSVIVWVLEGLIVYYSFLALDVDLPIITIIGIFSISVIIGMASFLPGGIGSIEIVMMVLLGIIGIGHTIAFSGIIIARFLSFWFFSILGVLSFIYLSKKINIKIGEITSQALANKDTN